MEYWNTNYDKDVFCQGSCCRDVDILARTIYGEARGEGLSGMEAIANVVLNRVKFARAKGGCWWGSTVTAVCLKDKQFSCWNKSDRNYDIIQKVDGSDKVFALCKRVARRAVCGVLRDNTYAATHYHNRKVNPVWARTAVPCCEIGNHIFYDKIY